MFKRILGLGFLGLLVTCFSLFGCGSKKGDGGGGGAATCASACNHVLKLAKAEATKEMASLPPEGQKMAGEMLEKQLDSMKGACVTECEKDPDPAKLKCALSAKSMADIEKCE